MPPYYQFKNDLVRDVVYGLMLYSQRRALHLRVAQWIEARPADELAPHLATLGRHWGLAGGGSEPDADALTRATSSLDRAADRANAGFANHEAVGLYREALSFVRMLNLHLRVTASSCGNY